jgi:hypothetical protein
MIYKSEDDGPAYLANFLKDINHALEIPDMESRQDQLYMTKVSITDL